MATKILLLLHVQKMFVRYPLAVLFSYLSFFMFVKIWLWYVSASSKSNITETTGDAVSNIIDIPGLPGGESSINAEPFSSGGGNFGGGGASGAFEQVGGTVSEPSNGILSSASGITDSGGSDAVTEVASGAADFDEGGIILIVLGLILVIIFGAGVYLVYQAPIILSEVAFDFLLATSLLRSSKKIDSPDWAGSVFRATRIPFLLVLIITVGFALFIDSYFPGATKLSEVLRRN
ncbi:MAG: hypothetical protein EPN94_08270 [Nitrospirae bacterium]|nr:MAG: hypothetical protein EPN94_08270 [Nitrospirota bacterium]